MSEKRIEIWIYKAAELEDLLPIFSKIFDSDNFAWDIENVWEWIEGYSKKYSASVKISRRHTFVYNDNDEQRGFYNDPLGFSISFDKEEDRILSSYIAIAKDLHDQLALPVSYGHFTFVSNDEYHVITLGEIR